MHVPTELLPSTARHCFGDEEPNGGDNLAARDYTLQQFELEELALPGCRKLGRFQNNPLGLEESVALDLLALGDSR